MWKKILSYSPQVSGLGASTLMHQYDKLVAEVDINEDLKKLYVRLFLSVSSDALFFTSTGSSKITDVQYTSVMKYVALKDKDNW